MYDLHMDTENGNLPAAVASPQQPCGNPRFAIINTCDAPQRRMVCEYVDGVGYCYMSRATEPHLKEYDGMNPPRPTSMESFGFMVEWDNGKREVRFTRIGPSTATYEDGTPRDWQDRVHSMCFTLSMVAVKSRIIKRDRLRPAAGKDGGN